jgi:hypothetical protein
MTEEATESRRNLSAGPVQHDSNQAATSFADPCVKAQPLADATTQAPPRLRLPVL